MREPVRVLVAVSDPPHGASDRARLADLVGPLVEEGVELRAWAGPHLSIPARSAGDPRAALAAGLASVDDLLGLLWADVIWFRRFATGQGRDGRGTDDRLAGFDGLLRAIAARPDLLAGRRMVYDIDADLLEPRAGSRAAAARAERAQVDLLLDLADVVTVATPALRDALARRVPPERLRVVPDAVDAAAYQGAVREPGRLPVVAAIDALDGPGGLAEWMAELARARRDGPAFRAVRLTDPAAPDIAGFDEVLHVDEGDVAWAAALVRIAPDVVLAPLHGDRFGRAAPALTWLEATAVGAVTLADGRAPGPYADLVDGRDARLVAGPREVPAALADLLASPWLRDEIAAGARERLVATGTASRRAEEWAAAFRAAVDLPARRGERASDEPGTRRSARREAIAVTASVPADRPAGQGASSVALAGVIPDVPSSLRAAFDAARRAVPQIDEIVLAGDASAIVAAGVMAADAPPGWAGTLRWVTVEPGATAGEALASAVAATTSAWVGILDASAELRPGGLAALLAVIAEHDLDAGFGELVSADCRGVVERIGGWPPTPATFSGATLLLAGDIARHGPLPALAELDDPVLDWVLALMEAGCKVGSAGVTVARELPPAARTTRIRSVGSGVPYADGGEDRLLGIIGSAADRGSTSDELARAINDWTSRYHLSRLRANIVRSVAFPAGARVIDVGAGTGTIARALGELGVDVVALEGSFDRARVAAVRCADLPSIEVIHGTAGDYENPGGFDAVVVIGVLEYSGSFQGGAAGPAAFLGRLRSLLRPDGVLVLAIENRLGLKYLQGYAEDHLARPWVGIDGYGGGRGIRTWSRRALRSLLADAGFPHQRWRYPFPDYKLPTLVIDEAAYREPDAATLVDALVRDPIKDYAHPRSLLRDDRGAHQGFLEAGLGEDVANSFLVIAGASGDAVERYAPSGGPLAWLYGDERVARWQRRRALQRAGDERSVALAGPAMTVEAGGLRQVRTSSDPFVAGPTLEQELKVALADEGLDGARRVLGDWIAAIDAEATRGAGDGGAPTRLTRRTEAGRPDATPFGAPRGRAELPGAMLDLIPANFIRGADGPIARIDREWQVGGPIDRDVALFRALWYVAATIVRAAWATPWPADRTIREIAHDLAAIVGIVDDEALFQRCCAAEAWLQARVLGADPERSAAGMLRQATFTRALLDPARAASKA